MGKSLLSQSAPSVLVLCVNYHNDRDTVAFVKGLLALEASDQLQIVVVDNSVREFPEPKLDSLSSSDPRVRVLHPKRNLGYFGGAAWGLRQHLSAAPLTDWVVVANTDISFPDYDVLTRLSRLPKGESPVIAPAIRSNLSGTDQNPYMSKRPSGVRMHFYKWVFRYYPLFVIYHQLSAAKQKITALFHSSGRSASGSGEAKEAQRQPIYAPHGAFMIFHRSYFQAGGSFDYAVFLFGEEIFVAETVRRLGLTVMYEPSLVVVHREHATTGSRSRQIAKYAAEASAYCADQYFGAKFKV